MVGILIDDLESALTCELTELMQLHLGVLI
jgi:hypothetical protein